MPLIVRLLCGLALVAHLGGCEPGQPLPRIEAIVPSVATPGAVVDVVGEGFEGKERFVSFAATEAEATFWQPRRVRVTIPELAPGLISVVLTVDGEPSEPIDFEVAASD